MSLSLAAWAEQLDVYGDLHAKELADRLGARWVSVGGRGTTPPGAVALFGGPLGWAARASAGVEGASIWWARYLGLPLDSDARWALRRFGHVVAGDQVSAAALQEAGAADVTVIGHACAAAHHSGSSQTTTPKIGWVSESATSSPFELFLLLRRLRAGVIGVCSRCGAPRIGDFDPWTATLSPPNCCGVVELRPPIDARAEFVGLIDATMRLRAARIIEWMQVEDLVGVDLLNAPELTRAASRVSSWDVQISFDGSPELAWSVITSAAAGVPCVVSQFGAAAALDNPASVRARTNVTQTGAVRASPDAAATAVQVHQLLTDTAFHRDAADSLRPLAAVHAPLHVDAQWQHLVERLAPPTAV